MEPKITDLAIDVVKENIVKQLEILLRVYKDTTANVNLPTGVNLHDVAERLFFREKGSIPSLNSLYLELVNQGTQSPHFAQVLDYVLHFRGM
jgi:hypothetical protein